MEQLATKDAIQAKLQKKDPGVRRQPALPLFVVQVRLESLYESRLRCILDINLFRPWSR